MLGMQRTAMINQQIAEYNAQLEAQAEEINNGMEEVRQMADEYLYWYPRNYCYSDAVDFFIEAIQNFRADSLKEAINLYVEELRHRQVMQSQQEISNQQQEMLGQQQELIRQQKINNVLTTANLFANLSTASAVRQNTAAVNANSYAVQNSANQTVSAMNNAANAANQAANASNRAANAANNVWKKL